MGQEKIEDGCEELYLAQGERGDGPFQPVSSQHLKDPFTNVS